MALQLLINTIIAILWSFMNDTWNTVTFITGFLVGLGVIFAFRRFFPRPFYLVTLSYILWLLFIFIQELISSGILVIKQVSKPKLDITPGIFIMTTELEGEWEIALLALLLSITPGSVVVEISPENDVFYIHAMDIPESENAARQSKIRYEKAIMGVTR